MEIATATVSMRKMMLKIYRSLPFFKGKLWLGTKLFKSLLNKKKSVEFTAHNKILYKIPNSIERVGVELLTNGIYEKKVIRFLTEHIRPGDNYFDVGANIGAIGLPVVKNKPSVKYIGFEASPQVFDYLKYNFKNNTIKDYQLYNYIVHEKNRKHVKFYQLEDHSLSSLVPVFTKEFVLLNSISLDSFCDDQNIVKINWIKIDVQGFELHVFKGLYNFLLEKKVDNILFEFEPWEEKVAGVPLGNSQRFLLNMGYELFDIDGKKLPAIITDKRTMIWAKPVIKQAS